MQDNHSGNPNRCLSAGKAHPCQLNQELPAALKTQNKLLFDRFKPKSFPFLVLMDAGTDQIIGEPMGCIPVICSEKRFIKKIANTLAE